MDKYTSTRITFEYLEKLRELAKVHKRSMMAQIEYMIDGELDDLAVRKAIEHHGRTS